MKRLLLLSCLLLGLTFAGACTQQAGLRPGDNVAVIGDSITEQRIYSVFIEDYLLMCQPAANLQATQFGWSGETAQGFLSRMANDCLPFHPTVATISYGMNDGRYSPQTPDKAKSYHDNLTAIVGQLKQAGVRQIVVGSPNCVDSDAFRRKDPTQAPMYNQTLADERDIAKAVAGEQHVAFADIYDPMIDIMAKAKEKYGHTYNLAGNDGIHPDRNGHLVMAYTFLKALGCNGDIGTITIDLAAGKATASSGHKVLSCADGTVEVESTRYPFCFYGVPDKTGSTRGVLEWLPFNEQLNRLTLVVKGAPGTKLKVTWSAVPDEVSATAPAPSPDSTHALAPAVAEFSAADLAKGVNLAAVFLDNPFSKPFAKVEAVIVKQQAAEVGLIKKTLHNLPKPTTQGAAPDPQAVARGAAALVEQDRILREQSAAAVAPVKHVIKIEVVP
jgi:lysophospholipase L1-like esterase